MNYKIFYLSIICLVMMILAPVQAEDVNEIIKQVQKKYDKMDDLSAVFKQVETFKLTGSQTEMVGKIYIKKGVKYRFESDDQTIVTDGKTVWTFNAVSRQLLIDNVRENSGALLPRDLLFKYPKNCYATLLAEEKRAANTFYVVKLDPKENFHGYLKSIRLWIDKKTSKVSRMETTDLNDNESMFEITQIDTQTKLEDSLFSFEPAPGVDVVDMR